MPATPPKPGPPGDVGLVGPSAYDAWLAQGNVGTVAEYLESQRGPQGVQGETGPAGSDGRTFDFQGAWDNAITYARDVVVHHAGSSWIALRETTGEEPAEDSTAWDELALRGLAGPKGDKGDQGDVGGAGLNAYEVAVANGFVGTVNDWLASLAGAQGEQGEQGLPGPDDYLRRNRTANAYTLPRGLVATSSGFGSGFLYAMRLYIIEYEVVSRIRLRTSTAPSPWTDCRFGIGRAGVDGVFTPIAQTGNVAPLAANTVYGPTAVQGGTLPALVMDQAVDLAQAEADAAELGQFLWGFFRSHHTGNIALASGGGVSGGVGSLDTVDEGVPSVWGAGSQPIGAVGVVNLQRGVSAGSAAWMEFIP